MMALLLLFYWVVIPILAALAVWSLWRLANTPLTKGLVATAGAAGFMWLFWFLAGGEQWLVDRQVRELCAKDGGVKVYETVKLPGEKFDKYGQINFYKPTQKENALGPEYLYKDGTTYYRQGNPDMFRMHAQVVRRSDGKLLGESVFYKRGGGDLPGPWHGSSFMCPELSVANDVLRQVFIKE